MDMYKKSFLVKWSELDPNGHVRHSAYNDYAAQTRVSAFDDYGYGMDKLMETQIGPVLFREEVRFLKEIRMNEEIQVTLELLKARKDGSKWSIFHRIYNAVGILSAEITVEGAWLDLIKRKIVVPPEALQQSLMDYPRASNFEWIPDKRQR